MPLQIVDRTGITFTYLVVGTGSCLEPQLGLLARIAIHNSSQWLGLPHNKALGSTGMCPKRVMWNVEVVSLWISKL